MAGELQFTESAGASVAYRVVGDGPLDLVVVPALSQTMRLFYRYMGDSYRRLASFTRLITFDRRGFGHSDPIPLDRLPTVEDWAQDIEAVMDAAESKRAALAGFHAGGAFAVAFATARPDRISSLTLFHTHATYLPSDDYPWAWAPEVRYMTRDRHRLNYRPGTVSPAQYDALVAYGDQIDVRKYLPAVTAPTLLLYREENEGVPVEVGEYIAQHMQNARLVRLQGSSSDLYHDPNQWIDELEEFLTGSRPPIAPDRFLAAVLFTDIVASTNSKAEVGDQRWKELLADHHRIARDEFKRHGGTEVNTTGDGFLATFDAPLRAIRCAHEIVEKLSGTDIRIRAGVHAGEIEKIGDDITGLTVDIGSRVAALAGADEVLVSGTVRDMAIGSGITFEERGTHELKGVPGQWRLYAALAEPTTFV